MTHAKAGGNLGTQRPRHAAASQRPGGRTAAGSAGAAAGRFLYASGARPLAGYTIKRGVGQGGFGEIYYAISDAGKEVALKLIRRNLDVELRGIRQCLNLKHPNLLDLYDIRQDDQGDTWVVMEYVADQSLEDVLAAQPSGLPPPEALAWIHGIGAGVAYLHDRGIVHRDLKPGNIFCDEGVVKVGDYGLSKFISCSRRSGHTESIGTVHYMAPEVANGRYGKEIDVYALGVILYELLTGRVPFEGESVGEVLMKHLTAKPDVSMLAEPYRSVVARALEKDPALRFPSAAEMLAALPAPDHDFAFTWRPAAPEATAEKSVADEKPAADGRGERRPRAGDQLGETIPMASVVPEEPILRALRERLRRFRQEQREDSWEHRRKAFFMIALVIVLIAFGPSAAPFAFVLSILLVPFVFALCVLYGVYRLAWALMQGIGGRSFRADTAPPVSSTSPPNASSTAEAARRQHGWRRWGDKPAPAMVVKPPRERLAELIGSLLGSSLVALAMCAVIVLIESYWAGAASIPRPEQFAWLLLVSMAGTWAVLIPAKLWEGARGEPMLRRFIMMVIGMGVGALAFAAAELLMVSLPPAAGYPKPPDYDLPLSFYALDGRPMMMAHAACFGTLFLLMRWWRQADPLRPARLSLWTLIVTGVVAGIVAQVWQFPQPWLPMVAVTISASVQLASPWRHPSKRGRHADV